MFNCIVLLDSIEILLAFAVILVFLLSNKDLKTALLESSSERLEHSKDSSLALWPQWHTVVHSNSALCQHGDLGVVCPEPLCLLT